MNQRQAAEAIAAGNVTADAIAGHVGLDARHVGRELKQFAEDPSVPIERERVGHAYEYRTVDRGSVAVVDESEATAPPVARDADGRMAVHRDYDWDDYLLSDVHEYIAHDGEWTEISALVDARETTGMAHVVLGGPTGCGKTLLAQRQAFERGWPLFTIQGKYSLNEAKLLGSPSIAPDGTTVWVDGTLTKAIMASAERPVVLLLDEINRARPEAKSVLFSALDDRCAVVLDGERGGEVIEGKAENLVVFATMNEGHGHYVQDLDAAEKRRLGPRFDVNYLGITYPAREATLIADRTPVGLTLSQMLVKTANEVRSLVKDPGSSVNAGIPTATLLDWARSAWAYSQAGVSDPVVRAGEASVLRMFYANHGGVSDVREIIRANLSGAPVDDEAAQRFRDETTYTYACDDCGWSARSDEDDVPESAKRWQECPSCEGHVEKSEVSY